MNLANPSTAGLYLSVNALYGYNFLNGMLKVGLGAGLNTFLSAQMSNGVEMNYFGRLTFNIPGGRVVSPFILCDIGGMVAPSRDGILRQLNYVIPTIGLNFRLGNNDIISVGGAYRYMWRETQHYTAYGDVVLLKLMYTF